RLRNKCSVEVGRQPWQGKSISSGQGSDPCLELDNGYSRNWAHFLLVLSLVIFVCPKGRRGPMLTRHGAPIIVLGVFIGMVAAGLAFYLSENLLITLGVMVSALALCASFFANWSAPTSVSRTSSVNPPVPSPRQPTSLAHVSLAFVTLGSLLIVWGGIW